MHSGCTAWQLTPHTSKILARALSNARLFLVIFLSNSLPQVWPPSIHLRGRFLSHPSPCREHHRPKFLKSPTAAACQPLWRSLRVLSIVHSLHKLLYTLYSSGKINVSFSGDEMLDAWPNDHQNQYWTGGDTLRVLSCWQSFTFLVRICSRHPALRGMQAQSDEHQHYPSAFGSGGVPNQMRCSIPYCLAVTPHGFVQHVGNNQ